MAVVFATAGCGLYDGIVNPPVGEDTGSEPDAGPGEPDTEVDIGDADVGPAEPDVDGNACGGSEPLLYEDETVEPGDSCGVCGDGEIECDGINHVICAYPTAANECGGCEPLRGAVGDPCGVCHMGTLECDEFGGIECVGGTSAGDRNACRGCTELEEELNFVCPDPDNPQGLWLCTGPEELVCSPGSENACGGDDSFPEGEEPGTACGECNGGVRACAGSNAVTCQNSDHGVNACGGCDTIYGVIGEPCGRCGGVWACDGPNDTYCDEPDDPDCPQ